MLHHAATGCCIGCLTLSLILAQPLPCSHLALELPARHMLPNSCFAQITINSPTHAPPTHAPPTHPPTCLFTPPTAVALELHAQQMLPAIWFIFSRRECDLAARHLELHGVQLTSSDGGWACRLLWAGCGCAVPAVLLRGA